MRVRGQDGSRGPAQAGEARPSERAVLTQAAPPCAAGGTRPLVPPRPDRDHRSGPRPLPFRHAHVRPRVRMGRGEGLRQRDKRPPQARPVLQQPRGGAEVGEAAVPGEGGAAEQRVDRQASSGPWGGQGGGQGDRQGHPMSLRRVSSPVILYTLLFDTHEHGLRSQVYSKARLALLSSHVSVTAARRRLPPRQRGRGLRRDREATRRGRRSRASYGARERKKRGMPATTRKK
mmetsp:Transcript_4899/g.17191  ORF Transcript_4899/g.17191 Transcript_4899/m.17191 type:complete len:232 (-) Transcript_4899:331-1026(-)